MDTYKQFLEAKIVSAKPLGFAVEPGEVNPILKPHQRDMVLWAVQGGRRAIFAAFGLGKTIIQLETIRLTLTRAGGRGLIVIPLGVRQEFMRDAAMLGIPVKFIRRIEDADETGIYLTNYETVRDGKLDPRQFTAASLDESSVLRGFGGTKTFREFMKLFAGDDRSGIRGPDVPYRFVATATPDPNAYIELAAYADFLGIMDVGDVKTRFFKRDSTKADTLTLHPHKAAEFWLWVSTWSVWVQKPSDLGHSDEGYSLPPMATRWHELPSDHRGAGAERDGQGRLLRNAALGVTDASREKRETIAARVAKLVEIAAEEAISEDNQLVVWCDLNDEQAAIEAALKAAGLTVVSLYGAQSIEEREAMIQRWRDREAAVFLSKPVMYGAGINMQQAHVMIFAGIGFKFQDLIQACHRCHRFLQQHPVTVHLIYTEAEREVRRSLQGKWGRYAEQAGKMAEIIQEHGLGGASLAMAMKRGMGVARQETAGDGWRAVNNDCVEECAAMPDNSVDLIVTSIPFSTQYEYTPNFADFGHTDDNAHFWRQMDFLTPQLLRILEPGRVAAIHVKDRITPGGVNGFGFQTVEPFSDECVAHFRKHGFAFLARKTITTDVVRENNQTYRLGWTEQCKDGSRMGAGMPEYMLLFRKPPTDRSNGYADTPVVKEKPLCDDHGEPAPFDAKKNWKQPVPATGYSRARWQIDAHGFSRSSGDRLLSSEELQNLPHEQLYKLWRDRSAGEIYNFAEHLAITEDLDHQQRLPATFMLLPPHSTHPDVWTDVARMRTLNGAQNSAGREMHLCLARGSLVLTKRGYLPIETVKPGDEVLTHRGRWRRVTVARKTGVRPVVTLKAQGVGALALTPDHKVWTRTVRDIPWAIAHSRKDATAAEPGWVRADATVGSYVNQKLPPEIRARLTHEELWLLGRWLADGHVGTRGDYWVSIGPDKLAEFECRAGDHAGTRSIGTAIQIRLKGLSRALKAALMRSGSGAANKQVPVDILAAPADQAAAALNGYLSGDGHFLQSRHRWAASSVSRAMLLGLAMLAQRAHGAIASVYAGRAAGTATIEGREVSTQQDWAFSFDLPDARRKNGLPFILDDGAWKKVRSADPAGTVETWCLRVEDDESFTAEGCIVKNCPMQFDIAERCIVQFSMPGETVFDPFMGIGTVPYMALKLRRRGLGVELGAGYWMDAVYYLRQAEAEAAVPSLFDLLDMQAQRQPERTFPIPADPLDVPDWLKRTKADAA